MADAGLTDRPLTLACFILKAEDSIPDLLEWNTREGRIFQQGGGAGVNLSGTRSSREPVPHVASEPVSFMRSGHDGACPARFVARRERSSFDSAGVRVVGPGVIRITL